MSDRGFIVTPSELTEFAERASWPEERLHYPFEPAGTSDRSRADERIARWRQFTAKGNDQAFRRILAWRGIDLQIWRKALSDVSLIQGAELPQWTQQLAKFMNEDLPAAAACHAEAAPAGNLSPLSRPFVMAASTPLRNSWNADNIGPGVWAGLEEHLSSILVRMFMPALRADAQELPSLANAMSFGGSPSRWEEVPGGTLGFLRRYPVLARLLMRQINNWREAVDEFLRRLEADRPHLQQAYFAGADVGRLIDVAVQNSDPHDGGRIVILATFSGGRRIVYKPRSLSLDVALEGLLDWLRRRFPRIGIRLPRSIDRGNYGWSEFIEHRRCGDDAEVAAFYHNAGHLLALAYVLSASDLHFENVIAAGPYLVPIDLETLLQPRIAPLPDRSPVAETKRHLLNAIAGSVLNAALVPTWFKSSDAETRDIGGLGDMALMGAATLHRPVTEPIETVLVRHGQNIASGFEEMYRLLFFLRESFAAPDGPLEEFAGKPLRYIFRNTNLYLQILQRSLEAPHACDGADHAIALERLARVLCVDETPPPYLTLVDTEIRMLRDLDFPRFSTLTDSTDICAHTGAAAYNMLGCSALERVRERVAALSDVDLRRQLTFLRTALQARVAGAVLTDPRNRDSIPGAASFDAVRLAGLRALELDRLIWRGTVPADGSPPAWVDVSRESSHAPLTVAIGDISLAYGGTGIALFIAAGLRLTAAPGLECRLGALLRSITTFVQDRPMESFYRALKIPVGLANGYGGIVYGLATIARIVDRPDLLDHAAAIADLMKPAVVQSEVEIDLHSGLSGAVVALACLDKCRPDQSTADQLLCYGKRLVATATDAVLERLKFGGLLGGPAGVALAALRLNERFRDSCWQDLCVRALARVEYPTGAQGWAVGDAGVLLARMAVAEAGLGDAPDPKKFSCLKATANDGMFDGRSGLADALAEAGRRLDRSELQQLGEAEFATLLNQGPQQRPRFFSVEIPEAISFGLLHGCAGIGYQLLRRADPRVLPFLLLFE